jgi:hypothetical protein
MCITLIEKTSKHRGVIHRILVDEPYENSAAAYMLLKRSYALLDTDRKWKYDWRYYFISRRTFLRHKRSARGGFWVCHYCGTVIEAKNKITVDHKVPKIKAADPTDSENFVECCAQCNKDKGQDSYENFAHKIGGIPEIEVLTNFNIKDFFLSKLMVIFN